ncbi:MAG: hypothetical protein PHU75_04875 [Candidatus Nanopelagicales bacterium]|nr:hypothetical protein [Candidatus Nanopelagicales bacterium]
MLDWITRSYPVAVVRRFVELELLDRSFGLAAQAFVALLPLVIIVVSVFATSNGQVIADQIIDRFGIEGPAQGSVRALFESPVATFAISWSALLLIAYSAFSLSRKLSRAYGAIFMLPPLARNELWRGLVWVGLQVVMLTLTSGLRSLWRNNDGAFIQAIAVIALLAAWFALDAFGLKLLVPTISRRLLLPTAAVSLIGRIGLLGWAAVYMPRTLESKAEQFGPIGVTFALFTLILVGVVVTLLAPLLVAVWDQRRRGVLADAVGVAQTT